MKKTIITISREYGSGGRLIGELAARKLGIAFYDRNLIDLVAHKSGLSKDYISQWEEKLPSRFVWRPPVSRSGFGQNIALQNYYSNEDKMFATQSAIIQELAEKESCIIVGRCADYVLRNYEDCLRVFIHAGIDNRIERVVQYYGVESKTAASTINNTDKGRAAYHNHHTDTRWDDYSNYPGQQHLLINIQIVLHVNEYIHTAMLIAIEAVYKGNIFLQHHKKYHCINCILSFCKSKCCCPGNYHLSIDSGKFGVEHAADTIAFTVNPSLE